MIIRSLTNLGSIPLSTRIGSSASLMSQKKTPLATETGLSGAHGLPLKIGAHATLGANRTSTPRVGSTDAGTCYLAHSNLMASRLTSSSFPTVPHFFQARIKIVILPDGATKVVL